MKNYKTIEHTKLKKRILVVGFMSYNERMYPHLYAFLKEMEKRFDVVYFGKDDRGHTLFDLSNLITLRISELTLGSIYRVWRCVYRHFSRKIVMRRIFKENISTIIVIDHYALNWVTKYAHNDTRLIYWSHDFITIDHHSNGNYFIRNMLESNRQNIKKCSLIIVQSPERGKELDSILDSQHIRKFYLPASLKNDEFSMKISSEKAQHPPCRKINIMQITISENRGSHLLLNAYQHMDTNIVLHFQGNMNIHMVDRIKNSQRKPVIHVRKNSFSKMREVISSMDIGYLSYLEEDLNMQLISKASGQMVEFFRFGIPIIAFGPNDLEGYVEKSKTGVYIKHIKDLKNTVNDIINNYSEYSTNARREYIKIFDIASYSDALYHEILPEN